MRVGDVQDPIERQAAHHKLIDVVNVDYAGFSRDLASFSPADPLTKLHGARCLCSFAGLVLGWLQWLQGGLHVDAGTSGLCPRRMRCVLDCVS